MGEVSGSQTKVLDRPILHMNLAWHTLGGCDLCVGLSNEAMASTSCPSESVREMGISMPLVHERGSRLGGDARPSRPLTVVGR